MSTFTKKTKNSHFFSNWFVHVSFVLILFVGFAIYDNISSQKPKTIAVPGVVPSPNKVVNSTALQLPASSPTDISSESQQTDEEDANSETFSNTTTSLKTQEVSAASQSGDTSASIQESTNPRFFNGIQVSFYKISRSGITELQKIAQPVNLVGESIGGSIPPKRISQLVSSGEAQYVSGTRYKDFDSKHPAMIFKGQRHAEAARNIGLFFQVSAVRKNESSQLIEVKGWGALKTTEPEANYFSGEMTLTPTAGFFVSGFLPRAGAFSDDEKSLFESDSVLKSLNQEDFNDGSTDIIMFIEFNKSN